MAVCFVLPLPLATVSVASAAASNCWQDNVANCFESESSGIKKPKGAISIGDGAIDGGAKEKVIAIANRVITLVAVVAIGGIVFAGFHMVTAFGDDEKHKKGKESLKWAVIGFAVALLSFPIVNATINFFYSTGG